MDWTYKATDLVTGATKADQLPIVPGTLARVIGDAADGDAVLNLDGNTDYLNILEPRKTVVWALGDNVPYWSGILWSTPQQSAMSATLPLKFKTIESIFSRRQVRTTLTYGNNDQFDIARSLLTYAVTKTYGQIAGFTMDTTSKSGVFRQRTYLGTDLAFILDLLKDLGNVDNGFEWEMVPTWLGEVGTRLGWLFRMGYPTLGRTDPSGMQLNFPGNVLDYEWPRVGENSANSLIAVGDQPTGGNTSMISVAPHGVNSADLANGFPLLENDVSYAGTGITDVATLNAHADSDAVAQSGNTIIPVFTLSMDQNPTLDKINLGDAIGCYLTSNIHPAGKAANLRVQKLEILPTIPGQIKVTMMQVVELS